MNTLLGYSYQGGQDVLPSAYSGFGRAGISPTFSRLLQHREKARSEEEYLDLLEQEMEKEKRSQLWGSIGGTAGGLLGAALLGSNPAGWALALASGVGAGAGSLLGSRSGYEGKLELENLYKQAERKDFENIRKEKGLLYGSERFKDLDRRSKQFGLGMEGEALGSGLTTAITAGLYPEGSNIYQDVSGTIGEPLSEAVVGSGGGGFDWSSLNPNIDFSNLLSTTYR
jgi:hypothetical protein